MTPAQKKNAVDAGKLSDAQLQDLKKKGWKGDPNDKAERLYPPTSALKPDGTLKPGQGVSQNPSSTSDFNSKHPRAKAGSPQGGQFVVKEGSGSSGNADEKATVQGAEALLGLKVDGVIDKADAAAISDYQKKQGLTVDGKLGTQTIQQLLGTDARGVQTGALSDADLEYLQNKGKEASGSGKPKKRSIEELNHSYRTRAEVEALRALAHEPVHGDKGKGLFGIKGEQLPAYMQHVINDLIEGGKPREKAIEMGIGIVKNWAEGHDGHGHKVSAETQAKAVAAVAEWEKSKAKAHAIPNKGGGNKGRATMFSRSFGLEDLTIRGTSQGGDGRTVEAYAAVFNTPTQIMDGDGMYEEIIDPRCFNKAIADAQPQGGRSAWRCGVFYNHGKTLYATPSERHSVPIGVCLDMRAEPRGLWTLTKYHRSEATDEILEAMREGSIGAYSFSGSFRQSTPALRSTFDKYRPAPDGTLTTVRHLESTLREYGPTPFPAYDTAEVVGMRAEMVAQSIVGMDPAERARLAAILSGDESLLDQVAPLEDDDTSNGTPPGAATGEPRKAPPPVHSARHHEHELWRIRTREILEAKGIELPPAAS